MLGTVVNSLAIVVAALLGVLIGRRFPSKVRATVMQALGLFLGYLMKM
jgi:uncharacterized membrane protein YqgA involved in biofilm formation